MRSVPVLFIMVILLIAATLMPFQPRGKIKASGCTKTFSNAHATAAEALKLQCERQAK
jgi:hypothetical protein